MQKENELNKNQTGKIANLMEDKVSKESKSIKKDKINLTNKMEEKEMQNEINPKEKDSLPFEFMDMDKYKENFLVFLRPPENEIEEIEFKKIVREFYSDPYKYNIDLGVPAPLRLRWSEVDEATKDKYPTAIECYCDGRFNFGYFLVWTGNYPEVFIELSRENKEISIKELNKCYDEDGLFTTWKYSEMLEEKRIYLEERMRMTKELLHLYNVQLKTDRNNIYLKEQIRRNEEHLCTFKREFWIMEEFISKYCVDRNGLQGIDRIHRF